MGWGGGIGIGLKTDGGWGASSFFDILRNLYVCKTGVSKTSERGEVGAFFFFTRGLYSRVVVVYIVVVYSVCSSND